jgi:hypothetical protein
MTSYTPEELASGWEFKIVRSATGGFKRTEFLQRVLEEEKRAGWTLVEKFDNSRVRLKRPVSARASDGSAGIDAYRSHVGISDLALGLRIAAAILISLFFILGTIALWVNASHK